MNRRFVGPLALMLLASPAIAQPLPCGEFTCVSIDVSCDAGANPSSCPTGIAPGGTATRTIAQGINPAGRIVGLYVDSVGGQHGFLLSGGRFTTIDVPGAVGTNARGISPSGDIVGSYTAAYVRGVSDVAAPDSPAFCPAANTPACIKGFLYSKGEFSTVLFPGHPGAFAQRISPDGTIYGCLHDFDTMHSMFGATWSRFGNTSLKADGGQVTDGTAHPISMNNGGTPDGHVFVGLWDDMTLGRRRGFVVRYGQFESYDVPVANLTLTAIWDINPSQQFVGTYVAGGVRHGFLQNPDGSAPVNIDFPGAAGTIAYGINPAGVIVGEYSKSGRTHGFVAIPPAKQ